MELKLFPCRFVFSSCQQNPGDACTEVLILCGSGDNNGAVDEINDWVARKTANKVKKIVSEVDMESFSALVLVNAIYFKGNWLHKFYDKFTVDEEFHVESKSAVGGKVKLMYNPRGKFFYGVNSRLQCQAIELPYDGRNMSMFVLLPNRTATNVYETGRKLTAGDLVNVRETFNMKSKRVSLWLPRFKLDERLSLAEMLSAMGMRDLFSDGAADLSGIDGGKNLHVSEILHRAVVEVNEKGTEAAGVTAVGATAVSFEIGRQIDFRADHPFIFVIQDKVTKSILFLGRFVQPTFLYN